MARKSSATILQEELYPLPEEPEREGLNDARLVDLDVEDESPFLRGQKRVSARRGPLPKKAVSWLKRSAIVTFVLTILVIGGAAVYRYGERSWRFRIESSDDLEINGTHNVPHSQVMEVLGGDIGRNIFFVPLAERKAQLEKIPWVESASVMRFVPNRLVVEIHERTPTAFARVGSRILLIDSGGTLMELPGSGKQKYSFPVILGMNPGEPLSTRSARMKIYNELVRQLDSEGAHYSQDLSEVDLSDQEDVKVLANDPAGAVLVHLGSSDFLSRYKIYVTHLQAWRQQFDKLESVDLRYEHQIIVNPDVQNAAKTPPLTPAATRAAMAAGVKPAALIHAVTAKRILPVGKNVKPAVKTEPLTISKVPTKAAPKLSPKRFVHRKPKHKVAGKKVAGKAAPPAKTAGPQPAAQVQETAPPAATAKATSAASKRAALSKKKPSPAVAKNQAQQDRP
jgi:cell division protein FtsQ